MEKVIKIVDGVEYERAPTNEGVPPSCEGCAPFLNGDGILCRALADKGCMYNYIFKSKDTSKSTTQGVKFDDNKLQYSLIPPYALEAVAQNLTDGLKKYPERNNWVKVDNAQERYMDALYRHLEAHRKGEIYDTDNVNPKNTHMAAVIANAMFLLEFMLNPRLKGKE